MKAVPVISIISLVAAVVLSSSRSVISRSGLFWSVTKTYPKPVVKLVAPACTKTIWLPSSTSSLMVLIGTITDFWPAGIVAAVGMVTSVLSLCEIVMSSALSVCVFLEIVKFPAFVFPSGSESGLTETERAGPSLSAITNSAVTIPPLSGVVPQLHDDR